MVSITKTICPDAAGVDAYREKFGRFMQEMQLRGYIQEG